MANCTAAAAHGESGSSEALLQTLVVLMSLCLGCLCVGLVWLRSWMTSVQSANGVATKVAAEAAAPKQVAPLELAVSSPTAAAAEEGGGCPFGYDKPAPAAAKLSTSDKQALRMVRVTNLYEDYIHLHDLTVVWSNPVTDNPAMEPCFAAAMHGIELAFILMAEFIKDSRQYVVKRPRMELVAKDVVMQCGILAQIVDGELEDEATVGANQTKTNLMQDFPFDGAPPTLTEEDTGFGRQSPGLDMLIDAVSRSFPVMSVPERHSIIKVIRNITGKIDTSFSTWSVGIGWEEQLQQLRESVGLAPLAVNAKKEYLNYAVLVRPTSVANTLVSTQAIRRCS